MATEASYDEHIGVDRMRANDGILIQGMVVIVTCPGSL